MDLDDYIQEPQPEVHFQGLLKFLMPVIKNMPAGPFPTLLQNMREEGGPALKMDLVWNEWSIPFEPSNLLLI